MMWLWFYEVKFRLPEDKKWIAKLKWQYQLYTVLSSWIVNWFRDIIPESAWDIEIKYTWKQVEFIWVFLEPFIESKEVRNKLIDLIDKYFKWKKKI